MIVETALVAALVWAALIKPLLDQLPFLDSIDGEDSLRGAIMLCRPHTVKGTILASTAGYALLCIYHSSSAHWTLARVLLSGVFANVFIVGVNQLVDVEIDRVNKKNLPLATGEITWATANRIVGSSLVAAVTLGFAESSLWGSAISAMCLIGVFYSVPPFRLKRFAVPAALCIVSARALLGPITGVFVYTEAMGGIIDDFVWFHMKIFTFVLIIFTTVIALMKDVPDMEGDVREGVRSLSVVVGAAYVSRLCLWLLSGAHIAVIACLHSQSLFSAMTHACALLWLHTRWIDGESKHVAIHNYFGVVWPLFYFEFLAYLLPIAVAHLGLPVDNKLLALALGMEAGYLAVFPAGRVAVGGGVVEKVHENAGLDISSLFQNLRLKGKSPAVTLKATGPIEQSTAEISVALNMHARLARFSGKAYRDAKKLVILCGDWLLARAVIALCETQSHDAIQEMGKAIASATAGPEEEITNTVLQHGRTATQHMHR
jgi:homogentisate phytyltransferase/homogentisate geranylgeranyltransferase